MKLNKNIMFIDNSYKQKIYTKLNNPKYDQRYLEIIEFGNNILKARSFDSNAMYSTEISNTLNIPRFNGGKYGKR